MEDKNYMIPPIGGKSILRNTGEEVEVIDSEFKERGARSDEDWVTYIDSKGVEHIKENLNIQLDFKPSKDFIDLFGKVFDKPSFEPIKFPSTENTRLFETAKELIVHRNMSVEEAVNIGKQLAETCKE